MFPGSYHNKWWKNITKITELFDPKETYVLFINVIRAGQGICCGWNIVTERVREMRNANTALVGKSESMRTIQRVGCIQSDNIKTGIKYVTCRSSWIHLPQVRDKRRSSMDSVINNQAL
jgi:hypothetical protein